MDETSGGDSGFGKDYSDEGFWEKVKRYALAAGREVLEKALWLYYALLEPQTPGWAKAVIISALGYFISPIDAVPDITPGVGYIDDFGVLTGAVAAVALSITDEVKAKAAKKLQNLFG